MVRKITWRSIPITDEITGIEVEEIGTAFWLDEHENLCFVAMLGTGKPDTYAIVDGENYMDIDEWEFLKEQGFDVEDAVHKAMAEMQKGGKGNWIE